MNKIDDNNHAAEKNHFMCVPYHNKNNNYNNKKAHCEGRTEEVREEFLHLCIHKTFLITLMHLFLSKTFLQ